MTDPQDHTNGVQPPDDKIGARRLRRILIAVGLVLAALILVVVAVYTAAFLILAPMMQ